MVAETLVLKDEAQQHFVPSVWRGTLYEVVEAFKSGDFALKRGVAGVRQLSAQDAERVAAGIKGYGMHLASLPEEAWATSACQWMRGYWDVLVDLYTTEEGASDLVLAVRVYEAPDGFEFRVLSVHVP